VRTNRLQHDIGIPEFFQLGESPVGVLGRVSLPVEIVKQRGGALNILVLVMLSGVMPDCGLDRQHVLPQAFVLDPALQEGYGCSPVRRRFTHALSLFS
jgi:hypothetical protein